MWYMVVDVDKFASQRSDDIKVTPNLWRNRTVVNLHQNGVHIVQKLYWKILKTRPFPSLTVDLEGNMLPKEVTARKEIFQCIENEFAVLFCSFSNTYGREDVSSSVCLTNLHFLTRITIACAVVLVVWHREVSSNQATQRVFASDTNVDECL
jgi:hypothetical protein